MPPPRLWIPGLASILLLGISALTLQPYAGNPTAFFHMDTVIPADHPLPPHFVVLDLPSYDGAQYYQIARNVPLFFSVKGWMEIATTSPGAYAYQRILLPAAAYVLALGQVRLLPWSFLLINLLSLLGACILVARTGRDNGIYALALAFSPAAMVALHFSLAEPLSLVLLTAFLLRYRVRERLETADVLLLLLFVLTREVNILFIGCLLLYSLWKRRWHDLFLLVIPCTAFLALHTLIYKIFDQIPFLMSAEKRTWPFMAIVELLSGARDFNRYTLSGIALFVGFVLPALLWTIWTIVRRKDHSFLALTTLAFLLVMTTMPDHIWGSITSIGRVITPVYPLFVLLASEHDTNVSRVLAGVLLLIGLTTGIGLALTLHPFTLS